MASRSKPRSLSELPGHLRVPILKRKDTERTQARLEAGLAGMEELRVLREQQQQLVGDTMARVGNRHRLQRRHSDNCLMTSGCSKISRSAGMNTASSHDLMSSWQSASSLASISEEGGDNPTLYNVDKNNNGLSYSHKGDKTRDYHEAHKTNSHNQDNHYHNSQSRIEDSYLRPHQEPRLFRGSSRLSESSTTSNGDTCPLPHRPCGDAQKSWESHEDLRHSSKRNDNLPSSSAVRNAGGHYRDRRSVSLCHDSDAVTSPRGLSSLRRHSTSMVNEMNSREQPQSVSGQAFILKGKHTGENQHRFPLSSISNVQASNKSVAPMTVFNYHNITENRSTLHDRNYGQISWDNLLKTIGISSSITSLTSLNEAENSDKIDNVFCSSENLNNSCESQPSSEKISVRKVGRSQSFSYGNSSGYAQFFSDSLRQGVIGNREVGGVASQEPAVCPHQGLQPIMRRASMQCEAVLTNSGMARRIVNPIQDVDMKRLTKPGPVHAVMLQYTSREIGSALSPAAKDHANQPPKSQPIIHDNDIQAAGSKQGESEKVFHNDGNECKVVEDNDPPTSPKRNKSSLADPNSETVSSDNNSMEKLLLSEINESKEQDVQSEVFPQQITSKKRNNNLKNSKEQMSECRNSVRVKGIIIQHSKVCEDDVGVTSSIPIDSNTNMSCSLVNGHESERTRAKRYPISLEGSNEIGNFHGTSQTSSGKCQSKSDTSTSYGVSDKHSMNGNSPSLSRDNGCRRTDDKQRTTDFICDEKILNSTHFHDEPRYTNHVDAACSEDAERSHSKNDIQFTDNHKREINANSVLSGIEADKSHADNQFSKHNHYDVSKTRCSVTSSDVSVISDEGYSTCDSVGPVSKLCTQSKRGRVMGYNSLYASSISETNASELGDTLGNVQDNLLGKSDNEHDPRSPENSNDLGRPKTQPLFATKDKQYESVAFVEQGMTLVWNPECANNSKKSLQRRAISSKSLKQTTV